MSEFGRSLVFLKGCLYWRPQVNNILFGAAQMMACRHVGTSPLTRERERAEDALHCRDTTSKIPEQPGLNCMIKVDVWRAEEMQSIVSMWQILFHWDVSLSKPGRENHVQTDTARIVTSERATLGAEDFASVIGCPLKSTLLSTAGVRERRDLSEPGAKASCESAISRREKVLLRSHTSGLHIPSQSHSTQLLSSRECQGSRSGPFNHCRSCDAPPAARYPPEGSSSARGKKDSSRAAGDAYHHTTIPRQKKGQRHDHRETCFFTGVKHVGHQEQAPEKERACRWLSWCYAVSSAGVYAVHVAAALCHHVRH